MGARSAFVAAARRHAVDGNWRGCARSLLRWRSAIRRGEAARARPCDGRVVGAAVARGCLPRLPGGQLKTDRQGRPFAYVEFTNALARDAALSAAPHRIGAAIAEVRPAAPPVSADRESATSNHGVFVGLVPTAYGVTEASQLGKPVSYTHLTLPTKA